MDKRGGLAKQLRSPLNMISRDDSLHDNDSSNDAAASQKGSIINKRTQSKHLGDLFSPCIWAYLSLKQVKSEQHV